MAGKPRKSKTETLIDNASKQSFENGDELKAFVDAQVKKTNSSNDLSGEVLLRKAQHYDMKDSDMLHLQVLIDSEEEIADIKRSPYYMRCKKKLTTRQETFLDQLLKGNTLVGSYRSAYNPDKRRSHASVFNDAWKLAQHPLIILEMRAVASQKHELRIKSAHEIREYVIERLLVESQHAVESGARVRSLELLGKIAEVGMFVNRTETVVKRQDPDELKRMLIGKLHDFFKLNSVTRDIGRDSIGVDRVMSGGNEVESTNVQRALVRQLPISDEDQDEDDAHAAT